jgi:hypothetical protein
LQTAPRNELVAAPGEEPALRERREVLLMQTKLKPEGVKSSFLKPIV